MQTNRDDTVAAPAPWQSKARGLTKREHFAGLAMMNIQNVILRKSGKMFLQELSVRLDLEGQEDEVVIARYAVMQADALIAELNRGEG